MQTASEIGLNEPLQIFKFVPQMPWGGSAESISDPGRLKERLGRQLQGPQGTISGG